MKSASRTAGIRNTFIGRDVPGRRLRDDQVDGAVALRVAKIFARAEQHALNIGVSVF
jgi:hypothetical protein